MKQISIDQDVFNLLTSRATAPDFVLQTPFDPSADGPLFDHDQGPQALFFLEVSPRT